MRIQDVLPRDAIPSIDEPTFGPEYFGDQDDEVIVVETTPARAYPVRILSYHEIVNDGIQTSQRPGPGPQAAGSDEAAGASRPIAVTWCPIYGSAVVFDRRVGDQVLTFGTSGKLADDALVMYDRETGSEWKQPLGTAIDGPLEGEELAVLPASMTSWARFRSEHPDGVVLQPVHGREGDSRGESPRAVYQMEPYDRYDSADAFGLRAMRGEGPERSWDRADIDAKAAVLGVVHDGDAVAYPMEQVQADGGVVIDTVGGLDVLVVSAGTEVHAFEHPGYEFELRNGTLYGDGVSWNLTTGRSDDGRALSRVPSRRLYAFAWQDDHGPGNFYGLA